MTTGSIIYNKIHQFNNPGNYNVNSILTAEETRMPQWHVSLKHLMLSAMSVPPISDVELNRQRDAAQCLQALLEMTQNFSFLWYKTEESLHCDICPSVTTTHVHNSVTPIEITNFVRRNEFDAREAIKGYFETVERGIERRCPEEMCTSNTCSKTVRLGTPPKFLIIQLKRFVSTRRLRSAAATLQKLNTPVKPFSDVEINTGQGPCTYQVVASIQHMGTQLLQGHYVAYVRLDNSWYLCNDERITALGIETGDPTRNAYLILLKLVS